MLQHALLLPLSLHSMKTAQFVYPHAPLMDSWSFVSSIFHSPKQCWHRAQRWAFHSKTCSTVLLGMHTWSADSYGNPTPNFSRAHLNGSMVTAPFTYSPVEPRRPMVTAPFISSPVEPHVWGPLDSFMQIANQGNLGEQKLRERERAFMKEQAVGLSGWVWQAFKTLNGPAG